MRTTIKALILTMATATTAVPAAAQMHAQKADQGSITVQNDRNVMVTVFVEQGDFDVKIGTVPAMQTVKLALPGWVVRTQSRLEFFVHPDGQADLSAEAFDTHPGVELGMIVPAAGHQPVPDPMERQTVVTLPPEDLTSTTITVENLRAVNVTVYVERGPFDLRIGIVPANETVTFRIPEWIPREQDTVDFVLHPAHGADLSSETMTLHSGAHLHLEVPAGSR